MHAHSSSGRTSKQHTAPHCTTLQQHATDRNALQRNATHCTIQYTGVCTLVVGAHEQVTHCNTLHRSTATHFSTLQHTPPYTVQASQYAIFHMLRPRGGGAQISVSCCHKSPTCDSGDHDVHASLRLPRQCAGQHSTSRATRSILCWLRRDLHTTHAHVRTPSHTCTLYTLYVHAHGGNDKQITSVY